MKEGTVSSWPAYVFHRRNGFTEQLRAAISEEAERVDLSLADTIRAVLCDHYELDCPSRGPGYSSDRDQGNPKFLLRVQPDLFAAIKEDAEAQDRTMREVVLEILFAHFTPDERNAA